MTDPAVADPWLAMCLECPVPMPCRSDWIFEPGLGAWKVYFCRDHGPVSIGESVSLA